MPDYSKGKIYTIRNRNDDSLIYVGSTIQTLAQRFGEHKRDSKKYNNVFYINVEDWNDWYIELYEDFPCNNKEQLLKKEGEVIRLIGNLNKRIEGRTKAEYRQENAEQIREQKKQYYIDNIEKEKERKKLYHLNNTKKIKEYKKQYDADNAEKIRERKKQYYIDNQERQKQYYINNAEKIAERKKKKRLEKKSQHNIEE